MIGLSGYYLKLSHASGKLKCRNKYKLLAHNLSPSNLQPSTTPTSHQTPRRSHNCGPADLPHVTAFPRSADISPQVAIGHGSKGNCAATMQTTMAQHQSSSMIRTRCKGVDGQSNNSKDGVEMTAMAHRLRLRQFACCNHDNTGAGQIGDRWAPRLQSTDAVADADKDANGAGTADGTNTKGGAGPEGANG